MGACSFAGCPNQHEEDDHHRKPMCVQHNREFQQAAEQGARVVLGFWVRMRGGAEALASEILGDCAKDVDVDIFYDDESVVE